VNGPARGGAAAAAARPDARTLLEPIQDELKRVDALYHESLRSESPHVRALVDHAALFSGKRLRPALVLLAGRASGRLTDAHVLIGAVVEMIHTATLLHDDVLDHATTRRDVPCVNALHGNEIPILLGDFIYAEAFALLSRIEDRSAIAELAKTTRRLCTGEIDQNCARGRFDLTIDEYLRIIEDKTAALYASSARLGAHYAGATAAQVAALAEYGRLLGIAFQIVDDCLDLAGDEKSAGKSLGTDLSERKLTLPVIRLIERVDARKAEEVRRLLAADGGDDPRAALRALVDFAPDVASARSTAARYLREAVACLDALPASPARVSLADVAGFVLDRER